MTARIIAAIATLLCIALPRVAAACPSCAGTDDGGAIKLVFYAIMILLPFGIAYVLYRVIRSADSSTTRVGRLP